MKKILVLMLISICAVMNMQAKENKDQKPTAMPAKEFNFPKYETVTLKNGMKVFVVEDKQQPTVNFRIMFKGGTSVEGDKTGVADLMTGMLTKGAGNRSALDIAELIDGLGIGFNASSSVDFATVSGYGLKKQLPTLLELAKDVLTAPTFPQDEFDKMKKLMVVSIKNEKSNSQSVAGVIGRKAAYGLNHPYARKASEDGIKEISVSDLKTYFSKYFIPNNATMVVIGDVSPKEIKDLLEKNLSSWKKGADVNISVPAASPMPLGVYFVARPGAVQSSICVVTNAVPRNNPEYDVLDMASSIMGAGFAGRLFKTLRETYSYTYTPFGYLTTSKYVNRISCGADVRADVTDSSIAVVLEQLELLTKEMPGDEELGRLKKYSVGQYLMAFANKDYVGNLIQNADFYGLDIEKVKKHHLKMQSISGLEIMQAAEKYMNPKSAYVVVVGDPKVKPSLEKFGKIYDFNMDYEPETGENSKFEAVSLSASALIDKYAAAIGGKAKVNAVKTLKSEAKITFEIQGQSLPGTIVEINKEPNMQYMMMDLGMMKQGTWFNGTKGWMMSGTTTQEATGEDLEKMKVAAGVLPEAKLPELGFKCTVLGKQKGNIVLKAEKDGSETLYYFDAESFLLNKKESAEQMPDGLLPITDTFSNYQDFQGIKLPTVRTTETPIYNISYELGYKLDEDIPNSQFEPEK